MYHLELTSKLTISYPIDGNVLKHYLPYINTINKYFAINFLKCKPIPCSLNNFKKYHYNNFLKNKSFNIKNKDNK